jgi:hypothetical protein
MTSTTTNVGPYDYLTDAIAVRDQYRADGYGANVITGSDRAYWVRVFYQ